MSCADGEATRSSAVPDGGVWAINAIAKNAAGKARHRFTRVMVISRFERYGLPCHSVYHAICAGNPTLWMTGNPEIINSPVGLLPPNALTGTEPPPITASP